MVDGARLVERAERRRRLDLGTTSCEQVQIIRWRLAGGAVDATVLAEVRLGD